MEGYIVLRAEIEKAKRSVTTETVQMTVGEVANMYSNNELNILPEFQRLFRWTSERKSAFVEFILIGIPVPSVFVFEKEDGTWELIDGLQRISTVLEFMGSLRDPDSGKYRRSTLLGTKYLPSLEGMVWEVIQQDETALDKSFQLFFRRARIDFQILKHPSDPKTKFDLFQRLNRGGAYANEQEVRTCSMVLADPNFTRQLRTFADKADFKRVFRVTDDQVLRQENLEYAVRLVVHSYVDFPRGRDVEEFLDSSILEVIDNHRRNEVLGRVKWTVAVLDRIAGTNALIPTEERHESIAQRFSLRALEGIAVGLARNMQSIQCLPDPDTFVKDRITKFWTAPEVATMSASGLRGTTRLQRTVPFGARWFDPNA